MAEPRNLRSTGWLCVEVVTMQRRVIKSQDVRFEDELKDALHDAGDTACLS